MDSSHKISFNGIERAATPDTCPHCGARLTLWEQVLLSVDRVLMCKNCWYRIILDLEPTKPSNDDKTKES